MNFVQSEVPAYPSFSHLPLVEGAAVVVGADDEVLCVDDDAGAGDDEGIGDVEVLWAAVVGAGVMEEL